jgi:hypothetical protein
MLAFYMDVSKMKRLGEDGPVCAQNVRLEDGGGLHFNVAVSPIWAPKPLGNCT